MSITNAQLFTLVGEELGIVSGTMALGADDTDKITRRHASVRAWLIEEGLCYWASDAIPDAVSLPLAQIVAANCADLYGRGPKAEDPYAYGQQGIDALKQHCSKRSAKEPVQADYF